MNSERPQEHIPDIANAVMSVLERVKDLYQVYPALTIVSDFLSVAPTKVPELFSQRSDLVRSLVKYTSSPVLHVPAYNFKTRNVVFKIYQSFLLNRETILSQLDNHATYISAVLGGIDEEKDPRNLLITYDLLYFMLREYASKMENKA